MRMLKMLFSGRTYLISRPIVVTMLVIFVTENRRGIENYSKFLKHHTSVSHRSDALCRDLILSVREINLKYRASTRRPVNARLPGSPVHRPFVHLWHRKHKGTRD